MKNVFVTLSLQGSGVHFAQAKFTSFDRVSLVDVNTIS